jgi:D-alanine-D-alanine ligase
VKIEIITNLNDNLKETGFGPFQACENVKQSLLRSDHSAIVTVCNNLSDLDGVVKRKPDIVVLAVKYVVIESGEFIWLSDFFDKHNISFTGSTRETLQYDSNKILGKERVSAKNIPTGKYFTTIPNQYKHAEELPLAFPLFLKPSDSANGNGIDTMSLVHEFSEYKTKVSTLYEEYMQPILVEEYLEGLEFTVSIIESGGRLIAIPIEIIPPKEDGIRILGSKVKTENSEILSRIFDSKTLRMILEIAEKSFKALGIRDFGRIDIKMDKQGNCKFMEANLVPGLKKGSSYFPRACKIAADIKYDELICLMIQGAIDRSQNININIIGNKYEDTVELS